MTLTLSRKLVRLLDSYQGLLIRSASQGSEHVCNVLANRSTVRIRTIIDMAPESGWSVASRGTPCPYISDEIAVPSAKIVPSESWRINCFQSRLSPWYVTRHMRMTQTHGVFSLRGKLQKRVSLPWPTKTRLARLGIDKQSWRCRGADSICFGGWSALGMRVSA